MLNYAWNSILTLENVQSHTYTKHKIKRIRKSTTNMYVHDSNWIEYREAWNLIHVIIITRCVC